MGTSTRFMSNRRSTITGGGRAGPSAETIAIEPDAKTGKPELAVSRTELRAYSQLRLLSLTLE